MPIDGCVVPSSPWLFQFGTSGKRMISGGGDVRRQHTQKVKNNAEYAQGITVVDGFANKDNADDRTSGNA